jgi:tetratricopeptide (TPR) repeat protein
VPSDQPRKRLQDIFLDPKAIAALFASAIAAILFVISLVFDLWGKLPDAIKSVATTEQQHSAILLALSAIVAFLLWITFAVLISLWNLWQERRRHPDGKPKPGRVAIYVAELKGEKENLNRDRIVRSLQEQLGQSVEVLLAGIELPAQQTGNPDDDICAANLKGRNYLKKHKGDLLIWGKILPESKLVELRFTSPAHNAAEIKSYNFTEKMLLEPSFGPELAAALAAIAAQLALPAINPGKYVADVLLPVAKKLSKIVANLPAFMGPSQCGLLLVSYANTERVIGEQRGDLDALQRAIAAYRQALKVYTREKTPLEWATTQICLGIALGILGEHESGTESLEAAAAAFREALKEATREKIPHNWAMTQSNLGTALQRFGERESGTERLEAAVAAYREALKEWTRERVPLQWATTQNGLGAALSRLGERESGTERLKAAVATYREALKEWTRKKVPFYWAATQNNLGNALRTLGEREGGTKHLKAAVAAYRSALKIYTREKVPLQWAMTQSNLGLALQTLGALESGIDQLKAAVAACREALKEYTRQKVPLQWATTQNNLGNALRTLGERESGTERLEAAVAAYREALKERTQEKVPLDWAGTQNNLGEALERMGKLDEAAGSYRLALQVLTPENHFPHYTEATNNLARVLEKQRAGKEIEILPPVEKL